MARYGECYPCGRLREVIQRRSTGYCGSCGNDLKPGARIPDAALRTPRPHRAPQDCECGATACRMSGGVMRCVLCGLVTPAAAAAGVGLELLDWHTARDERVMEMAEMERKRVAELKNEGAE